MSVDRVDRFYPRPPGRRDDPSGFARRLDAAPEPADAPRRRAIAAPESLAPGAGRPLPQEIAFLAAHRVPLVLLQYGATIARRQRASADSVLIAEGLVSEERFYRALAAELKVPYLSEPEGLAASADLEADAARGYARLASGAPAGACWLFAPRGAQIIRLMGLTRAAVGRPLYAITAPTLFEESLRRATADALAQGAAHSVERVLPHLCVRRALATGAPLCFILAAAWTAPAADAFTGTAVLLALAFLGNVLLRLYACAHSAAEERARALAEAELPLYSVVVALYREAPVARQLARSMAALDYPHAKLDVKFVVEADDGETAAALRAAPLPPYCEIIVAPPGEPRTKPRALNVALPFLRGSLVAVFDAEDAPEPDQLRKAAALFARGDDRLACLQASLCIHNSGQNWMTALFAIDYALLFLVFNQGASAAGLPFFLGGTSNHFRVTALRALGGWDAFNVTEDADLGLRLARCGYVARTMCSRTYEEAPVEFGKLVAQRSRWMKGWMQTALVHCRAPIGLMRDLGGAGALAVLAMFVGGVLAPLHGPLLACTLVLDAAFGRLLQPETPIENLQSGLWCYVVVMAFYAELATRFVAMRRGGLFRLWPALLFRPLWTLMLMLAAWRALRDLWIRPYHWDKTEHGAAAAPEPSRHAQKPPRPAAFRRPRAA
ncbi:glycosyltransferase [Methylosinus sp. Sm6]|uniref:glycosyltransferase n=1 Tax=Methylosinus sp. Sm6 TaxID=2866948 RepID=UPI001C992F5D|nr:glycosyltransferase [Methylosinus sp. Sm6]MBY6240962.1 glycosyltransferase [Methylosinus sp. Sm6]